MSRIGSLKPYDVETPHGNVRVSSRYRNDKKCYRLRVYGPMRAVEWMLPTRVVTAQPDGSARDEISHPNRPVTTIAALEQFRRELVERWEERFSLGPDDPGLALLRAQGITGTSLAPATFGALVKQFLAIHKIHVRPGTLKGYDVRLARWLQLIPATTPLSDLTPDLIRSGLLKLSRTMKPTSVNSFFRVLKVCLNYAVSSGFVRDQPHRGIKPLKAIKAEPKWWTPEEITKVLAAAAADSVAPYDALNIFALALYLGLRRGEIDRIAWSDLTLDCDEPVACVRSSEGALTKSGHSRYIPICDELKAILIPRPRPIGFVVRGSRTQRGRWLYRYEAGKLFRRIVKAAGVRVIRFHDMRHTFASNMLGHGVPVFKVARWLGHADSRTTEQVYAHLLTYDSEINVLRLAAKPAVEPKVSSHPPA